MGIMQNAEWEITYLNQQYRISNTFSPNARVVEVINGVLGIKDPISQLSSFSNFYYEINAYCSPSVTYTFVTLYQPSKNDLY